jgi:chaperone BCS1
MHETFTLRTVGRSPATLRALLEEARDVATADGRTVGLYVGRWAEWSRVAELEPRPLSSVFLPDGQMERIVARVEAWLAGRDNYRRRGNPWRLTGLFTGSPGSGKTATVMALAAHYGMDLYILSLKDRSMDDQQMMRLLLRVPEGSIVLLDDVDAVVSGRTMGEGVGVSFAALLFALENPKPGIITIQTTNHPERLDPAQVRGGRAKIKAEFGPAQPDQASRLFLHFHEGRAGLDDAADEFGRLGAGWAMCDLEGVLEEHEGDPRGAVAALQNVRSLPAAA